MQRADAWKPRSLFSSRAAIGEQMAVGAASRVEPRMGPALKIRLKESARLGRQLRSRRARFQAGTVKRT
jgi:hypothetical protein